MSSPELPRFPFHRDPIASGSLRASDVRCECCGLARGVLYDGPIYGRRRAEISALCPWCIADGSAAERFGLRFIDGDFRDEAYAAVDLPLEWDRRVFAQTAGFATFNPIAWWVHCGEPAEYVARIEPYELVFECRHCHRRQVLEDLD